MQVKSAEFRSLSPHRDHRGHVASTRHRQAAVMVLGKLPAFPSQFLQNTNEKHFYRLATSSSCGARLQLAFHCEPQQR
jgi:hypothetical protein